MRSFTIAVTIVLFLSSCLKQSIPEAMLAEKNAGKFTGTLSYKINGTTVSLIVEDVTNQINAFYRTLACIKAPGYYSLEAKPNGGEINFLFRTDSLVVGNYKHTAGDGEKFFIDYNFTALYVHAPADIMSFNITNYKNGYISGNFSGLLTPVESYGTLINFGAPSSVAITNGVFENVPVIY